VVRRGLPRAHLEELVYTTKPLNDTIERFRAWNRSDLPDEDPAASLGDVVRELARATREAGIWVVPTQVVIDHYLRRNTEAFDELVGRAYMIYLDPVSRRRWQGARQGNGAARFVQQLRLQTFLLKALHDAGVKLALGTDSETQQSTLMVMPGWGAHEELALYVSAGLTPYQALRTATADAAEFLGIEDAAGTVEVGKRADLLLVGGDPLEDVGNLARVEGVMVAGQWLPRARLDAMLAETVERHRPVEREIAVLEGLLAWEGAAAAASAFTASCPHPDVAAYLENAINARGYAWLGEGKREQALEAFLVNTRTFPRSANTYDSLAEAYLGMADTTRAIQLYERALVVDPDFDNAKRMLDRIRGSAPR